VVKVVQVKLKALNWSSSFSRPSANSLWTCPWRRRHPALNKLFLKAGILFINFLVPSQWDSLSMWCGIVKISWSGFSFSWLLFYNPLRNGLDTCLMLSNILSNNCFQVKMFLTLPHWARLRWWLTSFWGGAGCSLLPWGSDSSRPCFWRIGSDGAQLGVVKRTKMASLEAMLLAETPLPIQRNKEDSVQWSSVRGWVGQSSMSPELSYKMCDCLVSDLCLVRHHRSCYWESCPGVGKLLPETQTLQPAFIIFF
jgi:hypothetical protein